MSSFNVNTRPPAPAPVGPSSEQVASRNRGILIASLAGAAVLLAVLVLIFPHLLGR